MVEVLFLSYFELKAPGGLRVLLTVEANFLYCFPKFFNFLGCCSVARNVEKVTQLVHIEISDPLYKQRNPISENKQCKTRFHHVN